VIDLVLFSLFVGVFCLILVIWFCLVAGFRLCGLCLFVAVFGNFVGFECFSVLWVWWVLVVFGLVEYRFGAFVAGARVCGGFRWFVLVLGALFDLGLACCGFPAGCALQ